MEKEIAINSNRLLANKIMENLRSMVTAPWENKENINKVNNNKTGNKNLNQSIVSLSSHHSNISHHSEEIIEVKGEENHVFSDTEGKSKNKQNNLNQTLLGRKVYRDPSDAIRELADKHKLGNMKCQQVQLNDDKYLDDIQMIMKYAEEVHPFKLVIEFCQKFKWPAPEIDTFTVNSDKQDPSQPPVFKTTISVKNNTYKGEALGATKKLSKKKAAVNVLTNMMEDTITRDSMKIFVKGLLSKKDEECSVKIPVNDFCEDDEDFLRIKQELGQGQYLNEYDESTEKERVERILTEFYQNNPLIKLNFFKNKVKIPFSFTFAWRGNQKKRICTATLYVGSEVFGIGEDRNLKVAKYRASQEGVVKIIQKYGEDILKTKEERKNKIQPEIKEDIIPEDEKDLDGGPDLCEFLEHIRELMEDLNKNENDNSHLQRKFEMFCLKYERNLIPVNDFVEIEKMLAKLCFVNKTISIHFSNPLLVGSFSSNSISNKNKFIDLLFTHKLTNKDIKNSSDSLIKNFNLIFNDSSSEPTMVIKNRKDELNFDIEVSFKNKDYSFILLIRNYEEGKDWVDYLQSHNKTIRDNVKNQLNFNILRRLFRSWRRKFNLFFLKPEFLDWVILFYPKLSISNCLVKIFQKMSKDFRTIFKNPEIVPQVILQECSNISQENLHELEKSCSESFSYISSANFDKLFI